jgi:hypothetical protein
MLEYNIDFNEPLGLTWAMQNDRKKNVTNHVVANEVTLAKACEGRRNLPAGLEVALHLYASASVVLLATTPDKKGDRFLWIAMS